jgi:hypothetical protein
MGTDERSICHDIAKCGKYKSHTIEWRMRIEIITVVTRALGIDFTEINGPVDQYSVQLLGERARLTRLARISPLLQAASPYNRTGAPPQRGTIVNISSLFAVMTHPTIGSVSISRQ